MNKFIFIASIFLLINGTKLQAQELAINELDLALNDTVKDKNGVVLQEVIITANQQKTPVNIGKSNIKPMDLPQASFVLNQNTLRAQQANNLTDILKNANGVYIMGATGGYQEEIASRGFSLTSSNTFKNGIRYFNGMALETSGLEKVEFLKGGNALLYGNVSAGGILNLVTKKPRFDFGGEVSFRYGSFNTFKPTFDLYSGIGKSKKIAFRINGSFEKGESFRNYVESERTYFNPSILFKIGEKTQLLIEGDYLKDRRTPDFGAGIINYNLIDLPRDRFVGVSWGYFDGQQASSTLSLNHDLSDNWSINFINGIRFYATDLFSNTRPNSGTNGTVTASGSWNRSLQKTEAKDNYYIQQLDVKGNFKTGTINHQLLLGVDSEQFKTKTTAFKNYNNYDTINIFNAYDASIEPYIPNMTKNTLTTAPINRVGVYAQDFISFTEKWKLLAGLRYSYQDTRSEVLTYANDKIEPTENFDDAVSPRLGLVYQPTENHSIFASYSNSFEINTGQDELGNTLHPSLIDQFEVGIKNKFFDERLFLNITAYQITNDKFYQQSLSNGNTYAYIKVLAGEVRSQGVEIDITANPIKGLSVIAGYSFNETKYIDSDYFITGSELKYNPKNTANCSVNYNFEKGFLKGLSLGLINSYVGIRYAGRPTRIQVENDNRRLTYVPDYFQMDAALAYTFKKISIRTKLSNLFNELNYNIHDDNSVNPIAPRNYSVSLNYIF